MPILKPISGHGSTGGIRRYLEKGGRALARDLFNLSYDERDAGALGDEAKEACAWDAEMDATRAAFGTDAPWRGKPARTFKHFVLSPDPGDDIDLAALRELACSWALKHFGDHEIAIVYHDDNARGIPHAHIVVNNANLRTGYRMQTQHPEDLNRDLQDMARERGLSGLSNDRAAESPSKARGRAGAGGPRSRRNVYLGRAEKEITPDEFYLQVVINERDSKGRISVESQQRDMIAALRRLGVDVEKQLKVANLSSEFFKKNTSVATAKYQLQLGSAAEVAKVWQALDALGISNVSILKVSHSKLETYKQEVRLAAMRNARQSACEMAEAIGQSIGKCFYIYDSNNNVMPTYYDNMIVMRSAKAFGAAAGEAASADEPLDFKTIRLEYGVQAKFVLE